MILLIKYIYWHYGIAPGGITRLMHVFMTGAWHQFLITRHLRTLFAPWHRTDPSTILKPKTFGERVSNSIFDLLIRLVAACLRLLFISTGLVYQLLLFIVFMLFFIIWTGWPLILIAMIVKGLTFI